MTTDNQVEIYGNKMPREKALAFIAALSMMEYTRGVSEAIRRHNQWVHSLQWLTSDEVEQFLI